VIIQSNTQKKKEFRAFETKKVAQFKALNNAEAWLALLKLSTAASAPPKTGTL
jgi:hypothetical protein